MSEPGRGNRALQRKTPQVKEHGQPLNPRKVMKIEE
jgi:hypothetical protein